MKLKIGQILTVKHGHCLELNPCASGRSFYMLNGGVCHIISFSDNIVIVQINSIEKYRARREDVNLHCR